MTNQPLSAYCKGVMGENRACEHLCQRGMVPLFRRYHSPFGEIDLVMTDGDTLVFAEVKTRERGSQEDGMNAVTPAKCKRMIETARCFLGEHPQYAGRAMRFDVVVVTAAGVRHIPNAFEGSEW